MTCRMLVVALLLSATTALAQNAEQKVQSIVSSASFRDARVALDADHPRFVRELITLTEIPAPPFKETKRAAAYLEMLREAKLADVETDAEGNVMGIRKGTGSGPMLAVLAHLDTVFPEGTDVKTKLEGTKLHAPGVGDDTGALALMLSVVRAMDAAKIQTPGDIVFVGNVGEEGEGDLRGVKYLLQKGRYKDRIKSVISIDGGAQDGIVTGGLGSLRYRVTFKGPGGHSYGAFGLVSPAFAMGDAMARLSRLQVPRLPRTTFNVGVVGGGTSVNSIPDSIWLEVDMRSPGKDELAKLDGQFIQIVAGAVDQENATRSTRAGRISADVKLIGDRPTGNTRDDAEIVLMTAAAVRAAGFQPLLNAGSTDSNIPISLGIPALTVGSGAAGGGRAHALDEWIDLSKPETLKGMTVGLAALLAMAGMP